VLADPSEGLGVNSAAELAALEASLAARRPRASRPAEARSGSAPARRKARSDIVKRRRRPAAAARRAGATEAADVRDLRLRGQAIGG